MDSPNTAGDWRLWLITWFGTGYLRPAPGTWASAAAILPWAVVWWAAWWIQGHAMPWWVQSLALGIGALLALALGVWLGPTAIEHFRRNPPRKSYNKKASLVEHDPSAFVLDEVAGQWAALAMVPATTVTEWCILTAFAFVFFRVFDIFKVYPANQLEHLPGGWGVCADDLLAGVYAGAATLLVVWWWL